MRKPRILFVPVVLAGVLAPFAAPAQHGAPDGHLPASASNVQLVGKVALTGVPQGIGDVAALGRYAYVAASRPECAGQPNAAGTGVHVVDVGRPSAPVKVGFLPAEPNSYVSEGVHLFRHEGRDLLVHNNETCDFFALPVTSGASVWDITLPLAPVKLGQFGDPSPIFDDQTYAPTSSVLGFSWQGRAYAVTEDIADLKDVDIFDITPLVLGTGPGVLVTELGFEDFPGAHGSSANGDHPRHVGSRQKVIDGHNFLLLSYFDAGQILLDIDDPANPLFVTDSDFTSPDPETDLQIAEGNSHRSAWSPDGGFVVSTDRDDAPTRLLFQVTSGPNTGAYGAIEYTWTVPISIAFPDGWSDGTVYGGSGCTGDLNGNGTSDRDEVPPATEGRETIVFSRGFCNFSHKVETGQMAGYKVVIVGDSHAASRNGLVPDQFVGAAQGHEFPVTVSAFNTGHRVMHLLFGDAPEYTGPEFADLPPIGTLGEQISADTVFDGWGYAHLHDATSLAEIDTYAIPQSVDPAFASGFGNLSANDVETDPRVGKNLAYMTAASAGLRVLRYGPGGLEEVGHYIAEGGSNLRGVFPIMPGAVARAPGRASEHARPLILASARDSGLWILRYTGGG